MSEHKNLAEALAAFQGEAPTLRKTHEVKGSFTYKYVDLSDVVEEIKSLMVKHGLSFSSFPCIAPDGAPALRYVLRHASGDVEADTMPLMLAKADAQALGSAITYARRYALCAVLNIVADADDDGAAAKAAQERPDVQPKRGTNGDVVFATAGDIDHIKAAAKGLPVGKIKLAFTSVGLPVPDADVAHLFDRVPKAKAQILAEALSGAER